MPNSEFKVMVIKIVIRLEKRMKDLSRVLKKRHRKHQKGPIRD